MPFSNPQTVFYRSSCKFLFCKGRYSCIQSRFLCRANSALILSDTSLKITKNLFSAVFLMLYVLKSRYCCVSQHLHTSQPHLELSQSRKETRQCCSVMWTETNQLTWHGCREGNWNSLQHPTTGDKFCHLLLSDVTHNATCTLFVTRSCTSWHVRFWQLCYHRLKSSGVLCHVDRHLQGQTVRDTLLRQKRGKDDWDKQPVAVVVQWWAGREVCDRLVVGEGEAWNAELCGTVRYLSTLSHGKVL